MNKNYFTSITLIKTIQFFCFLLVTFFSISSYGQDVRNHLGTSSPGSSTLEIPAGVGMSGNSIKVQTWGAGGGGGGCTSLLGLVTLLNVGGGGGGGAFHEGILNNVGEDPDNVKIAYTIGGGGLGGNSTFVNGRNGGKSFFSTVEANGGQGGTAAVLLGSTTSNGVGGQGGQGESFSGGKGFDAGNLLLGVGLQSGAGGGGAGSGGNGQGSSFLNTLSQIGGNGGIANNNDGGAGGKGGDGSSSIVLLSRNGEPGGFPAGGGGGSVTLADLLGLLGRGKGGDGGNGQIKVTYTCPVYTVSSVAANPVCVSPGTTDVTLEGFLPVGKYTVTYNVSTDIFSLPRNVEVKVTTAGILKFTVAGLTTVGTSRITIKTLRSVDCSNVIDKYVDVIVSPNLTAGVSIAASSSGGICYGTPVTFTATPTNGGTAPVYQWRVNGVNVAGANAATYTNSTLTNGAVVTCVMTSNLTPCLTGNPATSNPITMVISGPVANPATVCVGGSGSLTVSGTCPSISSSQTASGSGGTSNHISYGGSGNKDISINFPALPAGAIVTSVLTTITYTSHSPSYMNELRVQATPPTTFGIMQNDIQVSTLESAGTVTNAVFGTWGTANPVGTWLFKFRETINDIDLLVNPDASISNITITVAYTIPGSIDWYTAGGTKIGSGTPFNPVGKTGSGLPDTSIAGTYTFYAACSAAPTCKTPVNFVINPLPTITSQPVSKSVCVNGDTSFSVTTSAINPTYKWEYSSDFEVSWHTINPNQEIGLFASGYDSAVLSLTAIPRVYHNYYLRCVVTSNSGCSSNLISTPALLEVKPIPDVLGVIPTQPTCSVMTGSVLFLGLENGWAITRSPGNVITIVDEEDSFFTKISELAPGNYTFTVSNGICTSETFSVEIEPLLTKTWKEGMWDGDDPTIDEKVIFESDYSIDKSVTACSCEVKAGVAVVFKSGYYLKLRNELIVDPDGILNFENNASLVQINDTAINSGNIIYKRNTDITRFDYTYWSSPVAGQTLKKLSHYTLFDRYFSYDPTAAIPGWQLSYNGADVMKAGNGYIVRGPQIFSTTESETFTGNFIGKPNNGLYNGNDLKVVANKNYLLGNPYPSAISADKFLMDNSSLLEGTLYFWTNNTPPVATGTTMVTYKYTASDYASYNRTGGIGTVITSGATKNGFPPNGTITAGQGFFAPVKANGNIVFNNSMRLLSDAVIDNSQFFKLSNTSKSSAGDSTTEIEKNRVWLNLTNEEGAFKQALVGYITGATNDYEGSFDGESYNGNQYVDFYSINDDKNLVIQGRALPFQPKDSVALGYKTTIEGDFKINIDHVDGAMTSQKVFLEDKTTQVLHDLKKEPYSFTTEIGTFNDRFVLRYEDKNAIIEDLDAPVTAVSISTKDKNIKIATTESVINKVYIYDFSGSLVYSDSEINEVNTVVSNLLIDHSALIVHVVLENGKKTVKKIMY